MSAWWRQPQRDPELGEALRRIESDNVPTDPELLRHRIVAAARPQLYGLANAAPEWWEWITGWSRLAVPAGLAASIGAALLIQGIAGSALTTSRAADAGSDSTLVIAAFSDPAAGSRLAASLIAPEENDWLLEQAVSQ